jgi:quercetin dioxygenase-like cupin family protein
MFTGSDPRAALAPRVPSTIRKVTAFGQSSHVKFPETEPALVDSDGTRHWFARGQHFVFAFTECAPGALLQRRAHPDESFAISPDAQGAVEITIDGATTVMPGNSVAILPPGDHELRLPEGGRLVRIFSHLSPDLNALCANADIYEQSHPNIDPYAPWPEPVGGYRLRIYSLDVPEELQKHGRIWRSRNLMFYLSPARMGPRDPARLSPHSHEGFEQGTFALEGEVIQHLRWPWTPNKALWREDEHEPAPQHSITIFPALVQHTTQFMGAGANVELVVFAPPRLDWSLQPEWVLNHDEYPLPPPAE